MHEFEPLLAEIEDRPLNPLGNIIFWLIIFFIISAALWLYFGQTDIVITAPGQVMPAGEEKVVQALDKGIIQEINAEEGSYVHEGEILAVIAPAEHEPALELSSIEEEKARIRAQIASDKARLAIVSDTHKRLAAVFDILPRTQYDETAKEIAALKYDIQALNAALAGLSIKRTQIEHKKQLVKSPIDGYINKVYIHTAGGAAMPADKLMTIVPKNAPFIIKAKVLNKDIGFVKEGMPVSIKIDAYDFQKYGILNGRVKLVSANSTRDNVLGEVFEIYIEPEQTVLLVEGKEQRIKYGMTSVNEIKTGKRRMIEFFIYPLIKYMDESIKVR